jgi:GT2 family glycosyltransferase
MHHEAESVRMISVIIPCYNAEPFLAEALESVMKQTRPVDEVLVVDDCSTDRSAEIARSYGARVISTGRNSGHAAARNVGIEAARGNLIAWLDADDYWNPNHCEVVCGLLERHPDAAVAYSAIRQFGTRSGIYYVSPRDHEPFDAFWESFRNCFVSTNCAVMWRSAYLEVGGFDPRIRIASDYDFWLRLAQKFRFVSTPEVTSNYRWHQAQISSAPLRQLRSVYESRYRFLQATRQGGDEELARLLEEKMLAIWDEDIRDAWWDPERLGGLLTLRPLVPGRPRLDPRIWLRGRLPARLVRQLDSVRAHLALRTRLARVAAPLLRGLKLEGSAATDPGRGK